MLAGCYTGSTIISKKKLKKMDSTYEYTIAPGCKGSQRNERCKFNELMIEYVFILSQVRNREVELADCE